MAKKDGNKKVRLIAGPNAVHLVWDADDVYLKACDNRNPVNDTPGHGRLKDVTCKRCLAAERKFWRVFAALGIKPKN